MEHSEVVRRLADVRVPDVRDVGGKAGSLGELLAAGFRVPDGVVLTAAVNELPAEERRGLAQAAVEQLGGGSFAVRSSGITEDGAEQSYAGMYETILDVAADDVPTAVERCLAGAATQRAAAYGQAGDGGIAVIVQRMVQPVAAGVALTADPISGDRRSCIVTAVRGVGDRLVSGTTAGDEWVVRDDVTTCRRQPEGAIGAREAMRVARKARQVASERDTPQDVEWAVDGEGVLWILQARPMTALPREVSWDIATPGAFSRAVRLGEWIAEPVTPLFESWLLTTLEDRIHAWLRTWLGQFAPRPYHVIVNGWYFYSLNFVSGRALARTLPNLVWHMVRSPRRVAGLVPRLLRFSTPVFEREWREELLPRYRDEVEAAEERVETTPVAELPAMVDRLATVAGDYFASITALSGNAYKSEMSLARFYRRHLATALGGSHLPLLAGFAPPGSPDRHAVVSLDWWHETASPAGLPQPFGSHDWVVATRRAAEASAMRALAASPRRRRPFRRLLSEAQHLVQVREEQVRDLTLAWPVLRRAVMRMGEELADRQVLATPEEVFFLTRDELVAALPPDQVVALPDVTARRIARDGNAKLVAPLVVGRLNAVLKKIWEGAPRLVGAVVSEQAIVTGSPASPGRATGAVRVIRSADEFDQLRPGDVLVAPLTAPAWTPLFSRAAAVVTDVGSAAAHASIIAREYGIPAIVGCGDATARLRNGMQVTVDGTLGNVEPA